MSEAQNNLETRGYHLFPSIFSEEEVKKLRVQMDAYFKEHGRYSLGGKTQPNAAVIVPDIGWALAHPKVIKAVRDAMGRDDIVFTNHCDLHLDRSGEWHKDSGGRDNDYFDKASFEEKDCRVYKMAVYLQDHTEDDSGLSVRESSQHTASFEEGEVKHLATKAGDGILFDVRLTHRGQPYDAFEKVLAIAMRKLAPKSWDKPFFRIKSTYWRLMGKKSRYALFFTFGYPNERTIQFSVNNMKRQTAQTPSPWVLKPEVRALFEKQQVKLAEDHFQTL